MKKAYNNIDYSSSLKQKYFKLFAIVSLLFASITLLYAQTNEYLLKAGFLSKFADYIEWPDNINNKPLNQPFVITVLGSNSFEGALEILYENKRIKKRKVKIEYIDELTKLKDCHVLFISKSKKEKISEIINFTKNKPILTVAETKGAAKKGVHINFYITERETINFEINRNALIKSGLEVDVLLLEVAKIVN